MDLKNRFDRLDGGPYNFRILRFRNISMMPVKYSKLFVTPGLSGWLDHNLNAFDIVHAHEYETYQNMLLHKHAHKHRVPYVLQAHGSIPQRGRIWRKRLFNSFVGRTLLRDSARIIALNEFEREQLLATGILAERIALIPNGIEIPPNEDKSQSRYFKEKYNLPQDSKVLLFLGRINEIKGLDVLVKAFAHARARLPKNTYLVISGPDEGYLQVLWHMIAEYNVRDRAIVTGPLYYEAKTDALKAAAALIIPSRYETFSIAILEAYSLGKPVIASRTGGVPEEVIDQKTGLLFEAADVAGLSSCMERLLKDPSFAQKLGDAGREFASENFSVSKAVTRLEGLYTEVLRRG